MISETPLLQATRTYAESVLRSLPAELVYHNLHHTHAVVRAVEEIGQAEGLPATDLETVLLAAWLHDLGYRHGRHHHEQRSAEEAARFLLTQAVPAERIEAVQGCILATQVPQRPANRLEEVICDADLSHLAAADGLEQSEALRKEFSAVTGKIGKTKWLRINVEFYEQHHYFTAYARQKLDNDKAVNFTRIRQNLAVREAGEQGKAKR